MTWSELQGRISSHLTVVSASLVLVALTVQAAGFGTEFRTMAIGLTAAVLLLGTLMYVRIMNASGDDRALVIGMNRLRAAYRELDPGIERYFVTGYHDDEAGVMETYRMTQRRGIGQLIGSTWLFVLALNALLAGVLSALVTQAAGAGTAGTTILGVMGGLLYFTAFVVSVAVSFRRWLRSEEPISPTTLEET